MVSVQTARQIHAGRRAAKRIRLAQPEFKDIFHPDHRPATIGLFGFIAAFSLFSLQLAISPFSAAMPLRQAEQLPILATKPAIQIQKIPEKVPSAPYAGAALRMMKVPQSEAGFSDIQLPNPEAGCYYRQVQCIKAPCPPHLVCPGMPQSPTEPVCGNQKCELGEADQLDPGGCGPFADTACLGTPAQMHHGSCPQDCGPIDLPEPSPLGEGASCGGKEKVSCKEGLRCDIDYMQPVCTCVDCDCAYPKGVCVADSNHAQPVCKIACPAGTTLKYPCSCVSSLESNPAEYPIPRPQTKSYPPALDFNQDGVTNQPDLLTFKTLYRNKKTRSLQSRLDVNEDGKVNMMDLLALKKYLPKAPAAPILPPKTEPRLNREQDGCRIGGCSSHLCYDPAEYGDSEPVTTCEYLESYACYQNSVCGRVEGQCQWQETEELNSCLNKNK